MELKAIDGVAVTVELEPTDCAKLVAICEAGAERLCGDRDEETTTLLARTYGAAFASFGVSIQALGFMMPKDKAWLYDELVGQQLNHLVTERIDKADVDEVRAEKARIDARRAA